MLRYKKFPKWLSRSSTVSGLGSAIGVNRSFEPGSICTVLTLKLDILLCLPILRTLTSIVIPFVNKVTHFVVFMTTLRCLHITFGSVRHNTRQQWNSITFAVNRKMHLYIMQQQGNMCQQVKSNIFLKQEDATLYHAIT